MSEFGLNRFRGFNGLSTASINSINPFNPTNPSSDDPLNPLNPLKIRPSHPVDPVNPVQKTPFTSLPFLFEAAPPPKLQPPNPLAAPLPRHQTASPAYPLGPATSAHAASSLPCSRS